MGCGLAVALIIAIAVLAIILGATSSIPDQAKFKAKKCFKEASEFGSEGNDYKFDATLTMCYNDLCANKDKQYFFGLSELAARVNPNAFEAMKKDCSKLTFSFEPVAYQKWSKTAKYYSWVKVVKNGLTSYIQGQGAI